MKGPKFLMLMRGFPTLCRVLGSQATPNPAPVPQASAPVSATPGPVSAQQVTNSPAVPPVTSSSSGTVTMNIAMTLYGSSLQPFTSDKQFAAASALAGVSSHRLSDFYHLKSLLLLDFKYLEEASQRTESSLRDGRMFIRAQSHLGLSKHPTRCNL